MEYRRTCQPSDSAPISVSKAVWQDLGKRTDTLVAWYSSGVGSVLSLTGCPGTISACSLSASMTWTGKAEAPAAWAAVPLDP